MLSGKCFLIRFVYCVFNFSIKQFSRLPKPTTAVVSVAEPKPVLFGRILCKGPVPAPGSTFDKTDQILNDILFVSSHIDKRLFNNQILINK